MERRSTLLHLLIAVFLTSIPVAVASNWPCPSSDITPCTCDANPQTKELKVSCTGVDEERLAQVFQAGFAFKSFTSFDVRDSDIGILEAKVFNGMSFKMMVFENSGLQSVEPGAFLPSHGSLLSLSITDASSPDQPFSWPLDDLNSFVSLEDLIVKGPFAAPKVLASTSLKTVSIEIPTLQELTPANIQDLQTVTALSLVGPLQTIGGNTFNGMTSLVELTISGGALSQVVKDAFAIESAGLVTLSLSNNGITTLEEGAIVVTNENVVIDLSQNQLSTVNEEVFKPILTVMTNGAGSITMEDNPLLCGCDLYWIVNLDQALQAKLTGVTESCHVEDIQGEVLNDFLEYQCDLNTGGENN